MSLRRGFKSEANQIAREIRFEMGLKYWEPLNPFVLAEYLSIDIVPISTFNGTASNAIQHFRGKGKYEFSAATIFLETERVIIHNDIHSLGRQSSNVAHEIAHGLLLHPSTQALDINGCRNWDKSIEMEADWLAGALLITDEAALKIVRDGMSVSAAATLYGVTKKMVEFRLNVTAARRRAI